MKFLAFSDVHEDVKSIRELVKRAEAEDIDFSFCVGDFSTWGRGMRFVLKLFDKLGKPFYAIPGNHEQSGTIFDDTLKDYVHCHSLHGKAIKIGNYVFLGHGGGGFAMEDPEFRKIARGWYSEYQEEKIVFVTHGPAFGTKLDFLQGRHVGNKDYRAFIERIKPKVVVSGHLHETVGLQDQIGKTKLVNPGWEGMVIEVK